MKLLALSCALLCSGTVLAQAAPAGKPVPPSVQQFIEALKPKAADTAAPAARAPAAAAPVALPAETLPVPEVQVQVSAPSLIFLDSTLFDNMLSAELESGKNEVQVGIAGKISLNSIPGRIDKWITAVAAKGEVTLLPTDPNSLKPKFILSLLPIVYSFIKTIQSNNLVEPANNYNAAVVYHVDRAGEAVIERIVFTKKKQAVGANTLN
ncbi:MAG: hypothetical protein V4724_01900 [Pseudomonadota bacterium]